VRDGRRREFERFAAFADPARRERIPDPNDAATFEASCPREPAGDPAAAAWRALVARLLAVRRERLVPHLVGAQALGATALGPRAVRARWRLGDRRVWDLWVNLGADPVALDDAARRAAMRGQPLFELGDAQRALAAEGVLPGRGFALQLGAAEEDAP
jgi:maltooligosyltrehalose trehalohydrolase